MIVALRLPQGEWPHWMAALAWQLTQQGTQPWQLWCDGPAAEISRWPAPRPLRAWEGTPTERARLEALRTQPHSSQPVDLLLDLTQGGATAEAAREQWVLVDRDGRYLACGWPWLDEVTQGQGGVVRVLRRIQGSANWEPVDDQCSALPSRYSQALPRLLATLAEWLAQLVTRKMALPRERRVQASNVPRARRRSDIEPPLGNPNAGPKRHQWALPHWHTANGWLHEWRARWRQRLLTEHWRVGVIDQPLHTLLACATLPPVRWITPYDAEGYWADPFALPGSQDQWVAERYDERSAMGHLEVLEQREGQWQCAYRLPVGEGKHVSFPNVFEMDGRKLAVAETGVLRECALYDLEAGGPWRKLHTLVEGVAVADPALFQWQGRYWLAFTDADRSAWGNLCLYHADSLAGPWRAHSHNPVRVDVGGARMAGAFFWHEGQLYRPGQDCSAGYGSALSIYRVDHCDPEHYAETLVRRFLPDPQGECPDGLHTLNAWGERTFVDGKRLAINWRAKWYRQQRRLQQWRAP